MPQTKIRFIGCGNISDVYVRVAQLFDVLQVRGLAPTGALSARAGAFRHRIWPLLKPSPLSAPPSWTRSILCRLYKIYVPASDLAVRMARRMQSDGLFRRSSKCRCRKSDRSCDRSSNDKV
jgi:hypothetical protein